MHAPGKGISQSALPYRRSVPQWMKMTSDEVKDQIFKLAKKGLTPSQIGVILRDSHGVAQVNSCQLSPLAFLCTAPRERRKC
jgi:small subunit ribosomal protein S13e